MGAAKVEHGATLWMVNDTPSRMFYAGQRWRVSDVPTRLRDSIWVASPRHSGLYGWRFQATSEGRDVALFDVYRDENNWHVHHTYT
jgi:hypothetical protein